MAQSDNAATRFVDSHLAAGRADKLVFIEVDGDQRQLTYGALAAGAGVAAAAMMAGQPKLHTAT